MNKLIVTLMLALAGFAGVQAQSDMFQKLGDNKDITVVYISKALLGLAGNMDVGNSDVKNLAGKLTMLEIYSADKPEAVKMMKKEAEKLLAGGSGMETLMKVKEGNNNVSFVARRGADNRIKELLMVSLEPDECSIMRFLGDFTMDDIEKITKSDSKDNQ
ncbi:MAG: DUF4252 domain-containing protein [Prevotellaceae bacterium]|jgi:hypothetical protein|nr:DUF4252 domain-containing protein [Prevotellaceae bacterium]